MARYLECSECKLRYEDEGSIKLAFLSKEDYIRSCKEEGYEAKGICPCPGIACKGEMILYEGHHNSLYQAFKSMKEGG